MNRHASYKGKRLLDLLIVVVLAGPAFVVSMLCATLVWLEEPGPVLLRQWRTGRYGATFGMFKLRTMTLDASPESEVPDSRYILRVGALLRRLSLDELPQLLNVLRGEMSIVGPRPNFSHRTAQYDTRQLRRLDALPGMTGLAQVQGRNGLDWDERTEIDLAYVSRMSLRLDVDILIRSVWAVVGGIGVVGHPIVSLPAVRQPLVMSTAVSEAAER